MPLLDLFWSFLWFFLFITWVWLLITVFGDVFRREMSGLGKAGWTFFVIILPFLGVFTYLILHGGEMHLRWARQAPIKQVQHVYTDPFRRMS